MKKIIFLLCICAVLSVTAVPIFAAEKTSTEPSNAVGAITVNEYDFYVNLRKSSKYELSRAGYAKELISAVKSTEIETELLRLSNLSSEELRNLGYDSAQIEILHSYEGEPIETNLALRGVFADLTCTPALVLIGVIPGRKIAAFALNDDFVYSEEFLLLVFIASVGILIIVYGERILNRFKSIN